MHLLYLKHLILSDPAGLKIFILLALSIFSIWITPDRIYSLCLFAGTFVTAMLAGKIELVGCVVVLTFWLSIYRSFNGRPSWVQTLSRVSATVVGVGLMAHWWPGFNNWKVIDAEVIKDNSDVFTMYLNFDKPLIAFFLLIYGPWLQQSTESTTLRVLFQAMKPLLFGIFCVLGMAWAGGWIHWVPEVPHVIMIWVLKNLLFVTPTEELIFRGVIFGGLLSVTSKPLISLVISSLLFGLAHFAGGQELIFFATLAGFFYGWAYWRTGRIEAAILTHFGLNLVHLLLFSYPRAPLIQ